MDWTLGVLGAALLACVLVVGWIVIDAGHREDNFKRDCAELGGHIYGSGLWLCLTDDGRVLEALP